MQNIRGPCYKEYNTYTKKERNLNLLNYNTFFITNLNSEYFKSTEFSEDDKNIFSSIHLSIPVFENTDFINSFYKHVTENCIISLVASLKANVSRETFVNNNPENNKSSNTRRINKHNKSNGICFLSELTVTQNDDQFLSLYIDYIIMTNEKPLAYHRQAQTWIIHEKRIMSLKESEIYFKTRIKHKNNISGFYLQDNTIYTFRNVFVSPEHRIRRSQYKNEFILLTAYSGESQPEQENTENLL